MIYKKNHYNVEKESDNAVIYTIKLIVFITHM